MHPTARGPFWLHCARLGPHLPLCLFAPHASVDEGASLLLQDPLGSVPALPDATIAYGQQIQTILQQTMMGGGAKQSMVSHNQAIGE